MIIRFPQSFRLEGMPATVTLSQEGIVTLLGELPGEITATTEDEIHVRFDSPRAAADFVSTLGSTIPYLASDMDIEEELLFNSLISERELPPTSDRPRASRTAIAALSVAIPGAVIAIAALVLGIIGIAI